MLPRLALLTITLWSSGPDAQQVIQMHEDALSRLHSIRVTIVSSRSTDGGATWIRAEETSVVKSGRKERFHETLYGAYDAGEWWNSLTHRDLEYSPTEFKIMTGLDPQKAPASPSVGQNRLMGAIWAPVSLGPHGRNVAWTRELLFIPGAVPLRQLYHDSRKKEVKRLAGPDQEDGVVFTLETPDGRHSYEVVVSPKHNYGISSLVTRYRGDKSAGIPPSHALERVQEFYDYDFGLSIPKVVRGASETDPNLRTERVITVESVNTPIPESELELEFLPGTRVNDFLSNQFYVWGEGKPAKSFRTAPELMDWVRQEDEAAARAQRARIPRGTLLAFTALIVVLAALIIVGSRLSRRLVARP